MFSSNSQGNEAKPSLCTLPSCWRHMGFIVRFAVTWKLTLLPDPDGPRKGVQTASHIDLKTA